MISTKAAPEAVRPQVNRVPRKACMTGPYSRIIFMLDRCYFHTRFLVLHATTNKNRTRPTTAIPVASAKSLIFETCQKIYCLPMRIVL